MRPKYVVIQLCPNMLWVADIDILESIRKLEELVRSIRNVMNTADKRTIFVPAGEGVGKVKK